MPHQQLPVQGTEVGNCRMRNDISMCQFKYSTFVLVFLIAPLLLYPDYGLPVWVLQMMATPTAEVRIWYCWSGHRPSPSRAENITETGAKCYWVKRQKTPRFGSRLSNILNPSRQYSGYVCGRPGVHERLTRGLRAVDLTWMTAQSVPVLACTGFATS